MYGALLPRAQREGAFLSLKDDLSMSRRQRLDEDDSRRSRTAATASTSSTAADGIVPPPNPQPLVIVSERGRHSDAQRRVVRAQAARASAAQSRVTRARNREEREGSIRDGTISPDVTTHAGRPRALPLATSSTQSPLQAWLGEVLRSPNWTATAAAGSRQEMAPVRQTTAGYGLQQLQTPDGRQIAAIANRQLPLALPRGFTALQQRLPISDNLLLLLSRTACFDFASPGVEQRLHNLLFDLISTTPGASSSPTTAAATATAGPVLGHPVQEYLRVACISLTIVQGFRANDGQLAYDRKFHAGIQAAWSQAMTLGQAGLSESKAAEASLWAMFILCISTGASDNNLVMNMLRIMEELQMKSWDQVRRILLDFIYPVSLLDEACRTLFLRLRQAQEQQQR